MGVSFEAVIKPYSWTSFPHFPEFPPWISPVNHFLKLVTVFNSSLGNTASHQWWKWAKLQGHKEDKKLMDIFYMEKIFCHTILTPSYTVLWRLRVFSYTALRNHFWPIKVTMTKKLFTSRHVSHLHCSWLGKNLNMEDMNLKTASGLVLALSRTLGFWGKRKKRKKRKNNSNIKIK